MTQLQPRRYVHPFPLDSAWLVRWRGEQPKLVKIEQPLIPYYWILNPPTSDKE